MLTVGLALSTALAHPLAVACPQTQIDLTVQQGQVVDLSAVRSHLPDPNRPNRTAGTGGRS